MPENLSLLSCQKVTVGVGFIILLSALMALTSLSTDIYLPAMPVMARELHGDAELTITGFLVGFTIAQLVWGPVSDHLGRKIPLFIGMVLFIIGSVGCAMSTSMMDLVFWRVFQALGACTGPMLARAMIRDLFSRSRAAQMLSTLMIVMAIAPIGGPLLGGLIIKFSTWPVIFWLLSATGVVMFLAMLTLPETLPEERRVRASLKGAFGNYIYLLRNRRFMRYTLSLTSYYMAVYAFIAGSPLVYISYFGVSPQHYGWLTSHRASVIGMKHQILGCTFFTPYRSLQQFCRMLAGFTGKHFRCDNFTTVNIDDHIEIKMLAPDPGGQITNVPTPDLIGSCCFQCVRPRIPAFA